MDNEFVCSRRKSDSQAARYEPQNDFCLPTYAHSNNMVRL
jgi:hypothetical protein